MADTQASVTSGQEPTGRTSAAGTAGAGYSLQAGDAGTDERSGTDGGHRTPSDERSTTQQAQRDTAASDMSHEEALAALKAARTEAAENRRKAKELDDLKREIEHAKLSETERLQRERDEAKAEIASITLHAQERVMRSEVKAVARELGLKPELALRLIDQAAVTYDEAGDPTNIHELIAQAITDYGLASATTAASAAAPSAPQAPQAPRMGATNPPRGGQVAGANGTFAAQEVPSLLDPRLWKR